MKRVIICGTRTFNSEKLLSYWLHTLYPDKDIHVISGGAPGADTLGERWAKRNNRPVTVFKAEWTRLGKAAGPIRNEKMAQEAEECVAFWDGASRGTRDMIKQAKAYGLVVNVIKFT